MSCLLKQNILFTELEVNARFDENMWTLNVYDPSDVHVLELLPVLLVDGIEMSTRSFLHDDNGQSCSQ
jgi:hypothetical protein